MPVRYNVSSVWVRFSIFSQLSIIQYVGLCVFSLPISFVMIERICILCLIIIIKSEVWTITHCLGLGHETMVCAVCLSIFVWHQKQHRISGGVLHYPQHALFDFYFRCNFVTVSNIEQNIWMDFHEIFRIGQTLHKEQPGAFRGRSKPPCRCRKLSGEYVYIVCVCVCVWRGVGRLVEVGGGILVDCFVSGYTHFIDFLCCFC